jgi:hypothetical protein
MKGLMKKTGRDNMMNRFKNFRLDEVPTREISVAQKLVVDYDEDQIRKISVGATSLFNWVSITHMTTGVARYKMKCRHNLRRGVLGRLRPPSGLGQYPGGGFRVAPTENDFKRK